MTIYYTATICDIDGEDYYPIAVKAINDVFDKYNKEIFGNYIVPTRVLDKIKDGIATKIDKFIEFPTEFTFEVYNIDKVEEEFFNNLETRIFNALVNQFTNNIEFCFDYKEDLDPKEYDCKSWEEYVTKVIYDGYIVIADAEDIVCYIEDTNYYLIDIGEEND